MCIDPAGVPQGVNSPPPPRNGSARLPGSLSNRRWDYLLLVALLGLCWPLLTEPGAIVQCDYPAWASIVHMYEKEVLPAYHWFWGMPLLRENAGEILGQPYSLSIILPWLLALVMPLHVAIKLVIALTYLTIAFGLYIFVRPMCCRFTAALIAYLCVIENLITINYGMWYDSISIGLAFWFWAAMYRYVDTGKARYWDSALLLLALTVLAHPIGVVMALSGWAGYSLYLLTGASSTGKWRTVLSIGVLPVLAMALTFPQIQAIFSGHIIPFTDEKWPFAYRLLDPLGRGLSWIVLSCAVVGGVILLLRRRDISAILIPALLVSHIIFLPGLLSRVPFDFPLKGGLLAFSSRFELAISSMVLIPFGVSLSSALAVRPLEGNSRQRLVRNLAEIVLALGVLGTVVCGVKHTLITQPRFLVSERGLSDYADFQRLCHWITENTDCRTERIYVEDMMGSFHQPVLPHHPAGRRLAESLVRWVPEQWIPTKYTTHYLALLSLRTPANQVNGFPVYRNAFNQQYCGHSDRLFGAKPEALPEQKMKDYLWSLNCRHVLAYSPSVCRFLETMDWLTPAVAFGRYHVFTQRTMRPHWAWWEGPHQDIVPASSPSYLEYHLDVRDRKGEVIYVSFQYHPNWKARLEGHDLAVRPWNHLMCIALPSGQTGTLVLRYDPGRTRGLVIVCLGLTLSAFWHAFARRPQGASAIAARAGGESKSLHGGCNTGGHPMRM